MSSALFARLNRECGSDPDDWKSDKATQIFIDYANALERKNFDHFDRAHKLRSLGKDDFSTLAEQKADARGLLWGWLTISPDESRDKWDFFKFKDTVLSFMDRPLFTQISLCFEQRGTCPKTCGTGVHVHILMKRNLDYPVDKFIKCCKSSFKKWCNCNKNYAFYLKWINSKYVTDKIEYMTSLKTGEGKALKQKFDEQFRKYNCLEIVYSKNMEDHFSPS